MFGLEIKFMSEEEKMLLGELYNSSDEQLVKKLIRAKKLCNQYNKLDIEDIEKGNEIIRELFSKIGNKFMIMPNFIVIMDLILKLERTFFQIII